MTFTPAPPASRPAMQARRYTLSLCALLLASSGCTTLGTNIKGNFACKAPTGTCAPMSNIDAEAIASLGGASPEGSPVSTGTLDGEARAMNIGYGAGEPVRTGERTMRVVFPAHTDGNGIYHDQSVAHFVAERSGWSPTPAPAVSPAMSPAMSVTPAPAVGAPGSLDAAIASSAPSATARTMPMPIEPDAAYARPNAATSTAPLTLSEAASGLEAPATMMANSDTADGTGTMPVAAGSEGAPSMSAIAAARAGHRIGEPVAFASAAPDVVAVPDASPATVTITKHVVYRTRSGRKRTRLVRVAVPEASSARELNRRTLAGLAARPVASDRSSPAARVAAVTGANDAAAAARRYRMMAPANTATAPSSGLSQPSDSATAANEGVGGDPASVLPDRSSSTDQSPSSDQPPSEQPQ